MAPAEGFTIAGAVKYFDTDGPGYPLEPMQCMLWASLSDLSTIPTLGETPKSSAGFGIPGASR